jgi:uncharacterized membrane protein YcaP (DUF421 family)
MHTWFAGQAQSLGIVIAKALLMYVVALVGLRLAHRRTLAQWTAIDFAAAVAIGSILGRTALANDQSFLVGATALLTILAAHTLVTFGRYWPWLAKTTDHRVRVLVDHGRLRKDQLRICGLTENDVLSQLRQHHVGSVSDLRYVLYETKGDLTIVPEVGEGNPVPELVQDGLVDAAGYHLRR